MHNPYQAQIQQIDQKISENQRLLNDPELRGLAESEITTLTSQKMALETAADQLEEAQHQDQTSATQTFTNCILEIRGGAGGDEAKIWATDLLRMYSRYAEILGLNVEYLDDLVIKIKGKAQPGDETLTSYEIFKYESGVHRVQRVPVTEAQGRIHTSTASVAVLPEVPTTAVSIREEDLNWQFMRSSGAGGQSVNKTSSAVRLTHLPSGLVVTARSERKQFQNREIALELLRAQLWEIEEEKRQKELGDARSAIGRNMRAEKIRTYNFPQNRVTDHRIHESWHNLETILGGELTKVTLTLKEKLEIV